MPRKNKRKREVTDRKGRRSGTLPKTKTKRMPKNKQRLPGMIDYSTPKPKPKKERGISAPLRRAIEEQNKIAERRAISDMQRTESGRRVLEQQRTEDLRERAQQLISSGRARKSGRSWMSDQYEVTINGIKYDVTMLGRRVYRVEEKEAEEEW